MSGYANISAVPDQNILYNAASGATAAQVQNQLLEAQTRQQTINTNDMEMVGRAGASLLNMPEAQAAAAYGPMRDSLQAAGFGKNLPAQYPGHAVTLSFVQRSLGVLDQYKMGMITDPATEGVLRQVFGGRTPAGVGGGDTGAGGPVSGARGPGSATRSEAEGGPPAAGSPGAAVAQQVHDFWIKQGYSEPVVAGIMAGGPGSESDFTPTAGGDKVNGVATSYGLYQHHGVRLANMQRYFGLSASQMPSADQQNQYAAWEISPQGPLAKVGEQLKNAKTPEEAATIWTRDFGVPADKTEIGRRARGAGRYVGLYGAPGTATAAAAPPGVQMGGDAPPPPGGAPGAYPATGGGIGAQFAPGGTLNPVAVRGTPIPAGRFATPVAGDVGAMQAGMQLAQRTPLPGSQVAGPPMVASTNPTAATPASSVEPPPQPGWGSTVGSYGGPPNRVMPPPVVAQPGASPAPAPPAQQSPPGQPLATGVNSPQFQQAQDKLRQAAAIAAMPGYAVNPRLQAAAAYLKEQAAALGQADSVVQLPDGRQLHTLTGKIDDPAKPLPHYVWDATQGAWVDLSGTNKPEAAPTPRATEGSATWDEQQQKWVPAVPGKPGAVQGKWTLTGAGLGTFLPTAPVPAQGNYDIAIEDLKKDRGEIAAIGDAGRGAQQDNLRVQEMRDILEHATTGPGTETAAHLRAWIARWTPGELSKWDGNIGNLSGPAAVEMFQKLGFVGSVAQERGATPRGGYQATKLFQQFNPGAQMLTSTNQGLLAQRLIANQAEVDYAQAAQDHYNTQRQRLKSPERDYDPLSTFDAKWQAQRNPQVYAAAIGALGEQDPEMWSRGLSKDEIQRVRDVVTRADPNAVINMPGEGRVVLQPNAKPVPPGFKVQ